MQENVFEMENIYYHYRKEAARIFPALKSREGAAEALGISPESLRNYELGLTKAVPAEIVNKMSDVYNAPELRHHYCHNECPIGAEHAPDLDVEHLSVERLTLKLLNSFKNITCVKETLIEIAADGVISENERPLLDNVLNSLDEISNHAQELRIWAEKEFKMK